ncbi:hypothetical protein OG194_08705 [Streptomyces sp. NBC_01288]|uniref:hypothetical protein n=1 Tax=Streptomyces sp. NBC_01288 TaxID=2903814 RepID=UPI002E0EC369|nr:hypothetical protein OG194_08705 [Streptomyces sp. NBC_01288]
MIRLPALTRSGPVLRGGPSSEGDSGNTLGRVVEPTRLRGERIVLDGEFTDPKGQLLIRTP